MRSAAGLILTPVAEIPRHPRTFKGSGLQELLEQTRRTTRRPGIAGTPAGGRAEGWSEIFREKGERRATRPARTVEAAESPDPRRRGDGDADRPACPLDLRPVRHRQADRGRGGQFRSLAEPRGASHDGPCVPLRSTASAAPSITRA